MENSSENTEIEAIVNSVNRSRNRFGYFLHIIFLSCSLYFQFRSDLDHWLIPISLVVAGSLVRIVYVEIFEFGIFVNVFLNRLFNILGFFFLGLAWGQHFYDVFQVFGADSNNVNHALLILGGVVVVMTNALIPNPISYFTLLSTLCSVCIYCYLGDSDPHNNQLGYLCLLFFLATSISYRSSHKQFLETVKNQVQSQKEKERFKSLINAVPGFVSVIDKDLKYLAINRNLEAIYPDMVGSKVGKYSDAEFQKNLTDFMQSQNDYDVTEAKIKLKDGVHHFLISFKKTPEGGAYIIGIFMDELVKTRNELRKKEAVAQYSAKLASLGQMAAGIAHEINNPLAIIQGAAIIVKKLVEEKPLDKPNITMFTDNMLSTCERISNIVRSLRNLSRDGEKDPLLPVSLRSLLNGCQDICSMRFKTHQVQLLFPEISNDIVFSGREVQLGQVIMNLLSNSFDAVQNMPEKWVRLEYSIDGENLVLEVRDSGPGIKDDVIPRLMEPFFTTKDINHGTGLGLPISKTIVESHGGFLMYIPNQENTTFRISIPIFQT